MAAADVFDALSSKRPYKPAIPINSCFEMLTQNSGQHFDPQVIDAFMRAKEQIIQVRIEYADID